MLPLRVQGFTVWARLGFRVLDLGCRAKLKFPDAHELSPGFTLEVLVSGHERPGKIVLEL